MRGRWRSGPLGSIALRAARAHKSDGADDASARGRCSDIPAGGAAAGSDGEIAAFERENEPPPPWSLIQATRRNTMVSPRALSTPPSAALPIRVRYSEWSSGQISAPSASFAARPTRARPTRTPKPRAMRARCDAEIRANRRQSAELTAATPRLTHDQAAVGLDAVGPPHDHTDRCRQLLPTSRQCATVSVTMLWRQTTFDRAS